MRKKENECYNWGSLGLWVWIWDLLNRRRSPPIGHLRRHKALSYEDATQWSTSESVACSLAACTIYQAMSVFHVSSFICKEIWDGKAIRNNPLLGSDSPSPLCSQSTPSFFPCCSSCTEPEGQPKNSSSRSHEELELGTCRWWRGASDLTLLSSSLTSGLVWSSMGVVMD